MTPNQHRRIQFIRGFTLIELMIVIAIVAILAAIAIPNYSEYVLKARRVDGMDAMMSLQLDQEKFRANCAGFAGTFGEYNCDKSDPMDFTKNAVTHPAISSDGYYTLVLSDVSATDYTITASPLNNQQKDETCYTFVLTIAGGTATKSNLDSSDGVIATPNRCWQR